MAHSMRYARENFTCIAYRLEIPWDENECGLFSLCEYPLWLSFNSTAKPCCHYYNLSDARRNRINVKISGQELCDNELLEEWYRFVGAARTKMQTTHVPRNRCGTIFSGGLNGTHPALEDNEVYRTVCSNKIFVGCIYSNAISIKNCGSYLQYNTIRVYCEDTLSYYNGVLSQTEPKSGSVKARQLTYRYSTNTMKLRVKKKNKQKTTR